jgi:hypothetical protein
VVETGEVETPPRLPSSSSPRPFPPPASQYRYRGEPLLPFISPGGFVVFSLTHALVRQSIPMQKLGTFYSSIIKPLCTCGIPHDHHHPSSSHRLSRSITTHSACLLVAFAASLLPKREKKGREGVGKEKGRAPKAPNPLPQPCPPACLPASLPACVVRACVVLAAEGDGLELDERGGAVVPGLREDRLEAVVLQRALRGGGVDGAGADDGHVHGPRRLHAGRDGGHVLERDGVRRRPPQALGRGQAGDWVDGRVWGLVS